METTIEIYGDLASEAPAEAEGWRPLATIAWEAGGACRMDRVPGMDAVLSLGLPATEGAHVWRQRDARDGTAIPAFLYDYIPQGQAREHLAKALRLTDRDARADLALLRFGAANPIGRLRLSSAVHYWRPALDDAMRHADRYRFTKKQVVERDEAFVEAMHAFGFIAAGSGSLQGAAPKFLLTVDQDGWYVPDMLVTDAQAHRHLLVKYPRGMTESDAEILRHEAIYLGIAQKMGLRTGALPEWSADTFFMDRFDRGIRPAAGGSTAATVTRLHQESLLSAAGVAGFGQPFSHEKALETIRAVTADPEREMREYIQRDMLNIVLGNTDNHGRNTALQITPDGIARLTPVFDVAPMFMDRSAIPRQTRWSRAIESQAGVVDWDQVIGLTGNAQGSETSAKLRDFQEALSSVPAWLKDMDAAPAVIDRAQRGVDAVQRFWICSVGFAAPCTDVGTCGDSAHDDAMRRDW
jgi:serine/threonine-protein kinase HipA